MRGVLCEEQRGPQSCAFIDEHMLMINIIATSVITADTDIVIILSLALQVGTVCTHFPDEQTDPFRA